MKFSLLAIACATTLVAAKSHRHVHRHADVHIGSPVVGRSPNVVTTVVAGPTETVYEMNGKVMNPDDVAKGIKAGIYVLVPETTLSTSTSASTSSSVASAAEFYQKYETTTSTTPIPTPTTTSTSHAPPTTSTTSTPAPAAPSTVASSSSPSYGSSGGSGLSANFPSGTIPCSHFPSDYGAVSADYLKLGGWLGIQNVPNFQPDIDSSISYISTVPVGSNGGCSMKSYCSYACPPGYQKSQWPGTQGNTGQSIGGLYCNANNMLELSRPSVPQLCIQGTGNVKVQNTLSTIVSICRTDYPGTESETVPLLAQPGQTEDLTCPDASNYYMHEGSFTSAQYYVNPSGVGVEDACQWQTENALGNWHGSPGNIGNWAPLNLGVGKGPAGTTFISLIPNRPTNPLGTLDFNVAITGGVSGKCEYKDGKFYNNGVEDDSGCTVQVTGVATYVFSD